VSFKCSCVLDKCFMHLIHASVVNSKTPKVILDFEMEALAIDSRLMQLLVQLQLLERERLSLCVCTTCASLNSVQQQHLY